ncbi:MAG: HAD-IA family hydrolase [Candidatus Altiarchaeota archaeon]
MVKAVLLDWDGTLWDVLGFMVETYTEIFDHFDLRPWTRQEYQEKFRHDWRDMLDDMGLSEHEEYVIDYWDHKISTERPLAYEWVSEFEDELSRDYLLGVVSSAPRRPLVRELERNDILKNMGVVVSGDDFEERKPSPVPFLYATRKLGVKPSECAYVGDMVEDIQACREADMAVAAVTWGLHSRERLEAEKPDFIADTPKQVLDFIRGLP